ncbi:MAG TPA: hypothetical protein VFR67_07560 [Pilimelia sp.]|nr:hypothetical protein [Pilimelia sp.]
MSAQELVRIVELLTKQVSHWTEERWTAPATPGGPARAEVVHGLIQRLADLAADTEGEVRRPVPRLENDLALPDQLRVVAADLIAAGASDLLTHAAAADVAEVRGELTGS